jgi:regulator of protease activity HflC (stomatin/prohibitin superfamily)
MTETKPKLTLHQRYSRWVNDKLPYLVLTGLMMTLILAILWHRVVIIIFSGEGGVLYKPFGGGTIIDKIYTEGLYVLLPFNQMAIYNTRVQVIMHEFDVLTNRGLPVTLKIAVRFRPIFELLGVLHQSVGPDYPQKIILPQIESVLRKGLGSHTPEEIYTNKDLLLSRLVSQAIEEIGRKFVIVDDIIIRSVTLPSEVAEAIEQKLVEEQKFLAYTFKLQAEQQEADRKRVEAGGIRDHSKIIQEQLSDTVLKWHGIQATQALAQSPNSKLIFIGSGQNGLPIMLNGDKEKDK